MFEDDVLLGSVPQRGVMCARLLGVLAEYCALQFKMQKTYVSGVNVFSTTATLYYLTADRYSQSIYTVTEMCNVHSEKAVWRYNKSG